MRDRIERQMEQRTTMLAGVSHDLRTILTRFKLQLAMAEGDVKGVEEMRADVDEMQAMLEDYMAFAKGDSSEEASRVNIRQMLRECRKQAAHSGKAVTLKMPDENITVSLRRHAFKRAIDNVLSNAVRFADNIVITARRSKRFLTIVIDDDGPGIPADQREEVFRPFYRLDTARQQETGTNTGLGLSIARDIIRSHGGEIKLSESRRGGLRVVIRVPV
ncbi:MAG: hypothetical protein D6773_16695 [Alphaproteobacteria bacterium]|nr:MAG: hypothetical protein D6773_16695 [Alphaproteobacteria bacterium]